MYTASYIPNSKGTMNKDALVKKRSTGNRNAKARTTDNESTGRSPRIDHENELQVSGHSTPLRQRGNQSSVEASPEVDYGCSPILLPCTQDCNEIAWDWHNNSMKDKESSNKNNLVETPKRTKLIHTKRTMNSPLLQKRLKRKMRTDNIEELAAELKALSEGIYSGKQNGEAPFSTESEDKNTDVGSQLVVELDTQKDDALCDMLLNNNKVTVDVTGNSGSKGESYDDLFDDSINDSMVKCSQAIEERLNLDLKKSSDLQSSDDSRQAYFPISRNSTGSSCGSSFSRTSPKLNVSSCLKTYSKNPPKANTTSSVVCPKDRLTSNHQSISKKIETGKRNNQTKVEDEVKSDGFSIPDDSFDDCLATCIESDKLLAKTSDFDDLFLSINMSNLGTADNGKCTKTSSKVVSSLSTCSRTSSNPCSNNQTSNEARAPIEAKQSGSTVMENRKFFKTKSLSEQNFTQTAKAAYGSKSSYSFNQSRLHVGSSVTSTNAVAKHANSHQTSNVNDKETNGRFTKYKSTSNLSCTKDSSKETHSVRCSREEIERKRMEAKMRLTSNEAKRKLQQNLQANSTQLEIPLKRPVKR